MLVGNMLCLVRHTVLSFPLSVILVHLLLSVYSQQLLCLCLWGVFLPLQGCLYILLPVIGAPALLQEERVFSVVLLRQGLPQCLLVVVVPVVIPLLCLSVARYRRNRLSVSLIMTLVALIATPFTITWLFSKSSRTLLALIYGVPIIMS
jgi:hypothetical protein